MKDTATGLLFRIVIWGTALSLSLGVFAVTMWLVSAGTPEPPSGSGLPEFWGEPISDRVVVGKLQLGDEEHTASFGIREGTFLTVRHDERPDMIISFAPALDESSGTVRIAWLDTETDNLGNVRQRAPMKKPEFLSTEARWTFQTELGEMTLWVEDVRDSSFLVPVGEATSSAVGSDGKICCVTCAPWTICGTSVELWCGTCTSGLGSFRIVPKQPNI